MLPIVVPVMHHFVLEKPTSNVQLHDSDVLTDIPSTSWPWVAWRIREHIAFGVDP